MNRDLFTNGPISEVSNWAIDEANRGARKVINRLAGRLDLDTVAASSGLAASHLRQALDMREGRNMDIKHHLGALKVATDAERLAWATEICAALGYEPMPVRPRTPEQRLARLEYRVATECGQAGLRIVDDERSKP